ncbi:MAG: alpha/beta fold hydrolase [Acidimicrobiia bacterium]
MRVDTDDGVGLDVDVRGDGPGLVLVHGFGGCAEDFAGHRDSFGRAHTVVTFDHRGHGRSEGPAGVDYSLDRLVTDVLCVADHVGLDRFHLLGYSMGGMVARRLALRFPDRLESLVLMNTSGGPTQMMDVDLFELGAGLVETEGMAALKTVLDDTDPLGVQSLDLLDDESPAHREFLRWRWESLSPAMYAAMLRELPVQPDDHDALRGLRLPVLAIAGEHDREFLEPTRRLADVIGGARFVALPGAGHAPQFEAPDLWFDAVSAFLTDLGVPDPS